MNRRLVRTLFLIVAFASCASLAVAQDWKGSARISGKVVNEDGKPVKDAVVKLRHEDSGGPDVRTNQKGEFAVLGIRGGYWNIDVEADGYPVRKISVTVPEGEGRLPPVEIKLATDKAAVQANALQGLLAKGDAFYKAGSFPEARAEYEKVLAERPDLVEVHRSLAFAYGREGNYADALKHLDILLTAVPGDVQALTLAANSALQLKDIDRAMGYLARIDDPKLTSPDPLIDVAIPLINANEPQRAVDLMNRAVRRFPTDAAPLYYRARAELPLQKFDEARADLEKYLSLAPPGAPEAAQAKDLLDKLPKP